MATNYDYCRHPRKKNPFQKACNLNFNDPYIHLSPFNHLGTDLYSFAQCLPASHTLTHFQPLRFIPIFQDRKNPNIFFITWFVWCFFADHTSCL